MQSSGLGKFPLGDGQVKGVPVVDAGVGELVFAGVVLAVVVVAVVV